jgi:murein DD-endopeptidase MepM/ murein hydrolase activator NlpD
MRIFLIIFILKSFVGFSITSEDSVLVELSVVDSSSYNGRKIYVFNDGSWEYEGEFKVIPTFKGKVNKGVLVLDSAEWYSRDWKNHKTFSYAYNGLKMKDSMKIDVSGAVLPTSKTMNSGFKLRWGKFHCGNDFACLIGTEIKSVWSGKVRYAQMNQGGYGNLIIVRHLNGLETYYAHLSKINVKVNDFVAAGEVIGWSGNTGHSTGPHLHFECRFLDNPIDPQLVFKGGDLKIDKSIFEVNNKGAAFSVGEVFKVASEQYQVDVIQRSRKRRTVGNM